MTTDVFFSFVVSFVVLSFLACNPSNRPVVPDPDPEPTSQLSDERVSLPNANSLADANRLADAMSSAQRGLGSAKLVAEGFLAALPCSHVPGVCRVALQPLGDVPDELIEAVSDGLTTFYAVSVEVLNPVDLPEMAWYAPRRRWRAERLLDFLDPLLPDGFDRIAGITTEDISTTKGEHEDWGILGLANMPGAASVFSSFRTRRNVEDVDPTERLVRVALHELGHTFGLPHCPTTGCYLEDAGGTVETIDRETFLCDICRTRIGWEEETRAVYLQ